MANWSRGHPCVGSRPPRTRRSCSRASDRYTIAASINSFRRRPRVSAPTGRFELSVDNVLRLREPTAASRRHPAADGTGDGSASRHAGLSLVGRRRSSRCVDARRNGVRHAPSRRRTSPYSRATWLGRSSSSRRSTSRPRAQNLVAAPAMERRYGRWVGRSMR